MAPPKDRLDCLKSQEYQILARTTEQQKIIMKNASVSSTPDLARTHMYTLYINATQLLAVGSISLLDPENLP